MKIEFSIDTLISIFALLVALYSVWYTRRFNHPRITIENFESHLNQDNYLCLDFSLLNISNTPITIEAITFRSNNKEIDPVKDYEGPTYEVKGPFGITYTEPVLDTYPYMLDGPITVFPNSNEDFKYYLPKFSGNLEIIVKTDRFLSVFSKNKSFVFRAN